jgi:hypothetical protein
MNRLIDPRYLPERCWVIGPLVVILNVRTVAQERTGEVWGWTEAGRYFRGRLWGSAGRNLVIGWIR